MKKENNNPDRENIPDSLRVNLTLDELRFLQGLLENLADRKKDLGFGNEIMPEGYRALETSSIEAYISGDIKMKGQGDRIIAPYITGFLFTCTKKKGDVYGMTWLSSLS
jgi:hypothetical protein